MSSQPTAKKPMIINATKKMTPSKLKGMDSLDEGCSKNPTKVIGHPRFGSALVITFSQRLFLRS
jgi:hypothetical protein